jgi:3',5'-cyclic AMP phosphodiesterase CpdA
VNRIIHFSDTHWRSCAADNHHANQAAEAVVQMLRPGDAVVLTGDVTDDGKVEQYAHALAALRPIADLATAFMVVPGNHDFGPLGNFYERAAAKRFTAFARELHADNATLTRGACPDAPGLGFIAVDSCIRSLSPFDFARGRVGVWQRRKLGKRLDLLRARQFSSVVVLHHHPFYRNWTMRLEDAAKFLNVVDGKADLVLFGHTHEVDDERWPAEQTNHPARTLLKAAAAACNRGAEAIRIYEFKDGRWA